ncbi:hypothetical protein CSUI_002914 [Cystoisospora suis]|uniref:Uncharacterized protein n=1 Tax=Cystoisospora suis TaxID=483139 RepID=A0A2C6L4N6_9APIC|nr:hypothetical protein CSUI_002914 [Cystoisospora suis]
MARTFSPLSLTQGREGILPVQRHLDEPRLDTTFRLRLRRLWRARLSTHEAQMQEKTRRKRLIDEHGPRVPAGSVEAIKLSPHEKASYSAKFFPKYAGPWVVVECHPNGIPYRVRDAASREERQVTRSEFKLLYLPDDEPAELALPRLLMDDPGTVASYDWSVRHGIILPLCWGGGNENACLSSSNGSCG